MNSSNYGNQVGAFADITGHPNPGSPHYKSPVVNRALNAYLVIKQRRDAFKLGLLNLFLISVVLFDLSNKCPNQFSKWFYLEYVAAVVLSLSVLYYFGRYFYLKFSFGTIETTVEQKALMSSTDTDPVFVTTPLSQKKRKQIPELIDVADYSWQQSPNTTWSRCNNSQNSTGMLNTSVSMNNSNINLSTQSMSPRTYLTKKDIITDEISLRQYIKETSLTEDMSADVLDSSQKLNSTTFNHVWNYCHDAANILKNSLYQLSPSNTSPGEKPNEFYGSLDFDGCSDLLRNISSTKLTQYVANLRIWISKTILKRLTYEIAKTDNAFKKGICDFQIGNVALDRLKKTAENQQLVNLHVPMLPQIIPFLEMSTNQEYLVKRIKDLGKDSCIGDFRWNGGSSYHGLNWDEHLPTDSAIIFHLFCAYMDNQLLPLPQSGGRSFYNRYVVVSDKNMTQDMIIEAQNKNKSKCAILCSDPMRPKLNFISDNKVHKCRQDRNNLFYVIIQFLLYMKSHNNSTLEGVNLGKSGINIMCVIDD